MVETEKVTGYSGLSSRRLSRLLEAFRQLKHRQGELYEPQKIEYEAIQAERTKRRQHYRTKILGEEEG